MGKRKAIVFDIDGTLTPQVSWTAFTRDIGGSVADHLAIYHEHLEGKIGLDESKARLLKMWQVTGKAKKDHILQTFEAWPVRPEAYPLVEWLKQGGYQICLITGSLGIYAKYIAGKLGVDDYYANAELYFDDKGDLTGFHYTTNQAEIKLKHFEEFCSKYNLDPTDCIPIGDSDNDIGLFRKTRKGILINGGVENIAKELREAAWKEVSSLEAVKYLLADN